MGSLTTCLKRTRAGLAPGDEDAIVNAAADLRDTGLKASEAAQKAVRDLLAQAIAARNELKPKPEPVSAPAPAAPRNASLNVGDKKYPATVMGSRLLAIVNKAGGLSPSLISEFSERVTTTKIDKKTGKLRMIWRNPIVPQGFLFRAGGTSDYSRLGELMEENGYLPPGTAAADYKAAGEAAKDMIKAALISRKEAPTQDDVIAEAQASQDAERDAYYAELEAEAAREAEAEREAIIAEASAPVARIDDMADDDVPWDAVGTVGSDQDAAAFLGITIEEFQREQGRLQGAVRQDEPAQAGSGQGDPADAGRAAGPTAEAGSAAARDRPAEEGLTISQGGPVAPGPAGGSVAQLGRVMRQAGWEIAYVDIDMTGERPKADIKIERNDGRWVFAKVDAQGRASFETFQRDRRLGIDPKNPQARLAPQINDQFLGRNKFEGARSMLRGMTQYLVDNALNPVALSDMRAAWAPLLSNGASIGTDAPALTLEAQTTADLQAKAEREQAAADRERKTKAAEQERLRQEAEGRDLKARADQTLDSFELGQSADQQMSGMGDMFADAPAVKPNTIFTEDAAAAARARLKAKLGRLQSGIDPETMMDGITLAGYHIEKGARTFAAYARAMVDDLGDAVKPYLQSWYMAVRADPRAGSFKTDMDKASAVEDVDVDAVLAQNAAQEPADVPNSNPDLERDRGNAGAANAAVGGSVQGNGPADSAAAAGSQTGSSRSGRPNDPSLPAGGAASLRELGDQPVRGADRAAKPAEFDARGRDGQRSDDPGIAGVQPEAVATSKVEDAAVKGLDDAGKRARQREADSTPVVPGDLANIRATLPYLLPGQQEDVHKAEQRFAKPEGYGMLFTNGTGTGKTFTGLGIVKRFVRQGKSDILIVVPDAKIMADWVDSGRALGLTLTPLEDTKQSGKGVTITTYANLGMNDDLARRSWDLVVPDEAHMLMQAADGGDTLALSALRAISMHPRGAYDRFYMLNRADIEKRTELGKQIKANESIRNLDDTMDVMRDSLEAENKKLTAQWEALNKQLEAERERIKQEVADAQGAGRTRLAALSATPFAYEPTIDWAEGYLFDYGNPNEDGRSYNRGNAREQFFVQHFGYRMRFNKLTKPDAKVDSGLMQRQFNGWLKKEGSLSARMLDVAADYDRRFVLVESAIGNAIDRAMDFIQEKARAADKAETERLKADDYKSDRIANGWEFLNAQLSEALYGKLGHLTRRYLLEAIKAKEVVPHVREHLAMGRKVVVFHDFKKGGSGNPFSFEQRRVPTVKPADMSAEDFERAKAGIGAYNQAAREFAKEFPELIGDLMANLSSPIARFTQAFPGVLLINGDEKPADLLARYKRFQDDASGPVVALVQSDKNKGWSGHDTTGKHQRVLFNLGLPTQPTKSIQQEGRIYRTGQVSDAMFRYLNTGTNWERWAFAQTIAERASAAENLGMGEYARALKDSFIAGFEESGDFRAGHEGEGKGGKARDAAANNALSEYDRAKAFYFGTQKKDSRTKAQEGVDYFATPEPLGLKMVQWADERGGEDSLEPSAGHGAIARWSSEKVNRTAIEPSNNLGSRLAMVFDGKIIRGTFEDHNVVNKYDTIKMNPPFGTAGRTAIDHLAKAATHLRDGGRIVALIPTGPAADKKFDKWMYEESERPSRPVFQSKAGPVHAGDKLKWNVFGHAGQEQSGTFVKRHSDGRVTASKGGHETTFWENQIVGVEAGPRTESFSPAAGLYLVADIKLPAVTFERAGTKVMTRVVVIEKPIKGQDAPQQINRDLSDITDIGQLFDRLEGMNLAPRAKPAEDAPAAAPDAAPPRAADKVEAQKAGAAVAAETGAKIVEHFVQKTGKTIKGVIRTDLTKEQAQQVDKYTWKKDGGFFIRVEHLAKLNEKFPPAGDMPVLSQSTRSPKGVPAADLRRMVDALSASWKGLRARPEVAATAADLPQNIVDALRSMNALGTTRGLRMPDGKVYLIANKLDSMKESQAVLFHEVLGHEGLRAFLGDSYLNMMGALRMANPALAAEANTWYARFGQDQIDARVEAGMSPAEAGALVRALAVEEALADRAGMGVVPKAWKSVMAALQRALRRIKGMEWIADWLEKKTEAETYAVLMGARRAIERGTGDLVERLTGNAEPVASRKELPTNPKDTSRYQGLKWEPSTDDMVTAEVGNGWTANIVLDEDGSAELSILTPGGSDFGEAIVYPDFQTARLAAPAILARRISPDGIQAGDSTAGTFNDLSRVGDRIMQMGYEKQSVPRVQAARKMAGLIKRLEEGEITEAYFTMAVKMLAEKMSEVSTTKSANRLMTERERGPDIVREKLIRARRQGVLEPTVVEFALWVIDKNESLAADLGISIRSPKDDASAGDYNPATSVLRIFKGAGNEDVAVHEIMHHAERMMPEDMQAAIRREWSKALANAIKKASPEMRAALALIPEAMVGGRAEYKALVKAIQEGPLNYAEHYQLVNPSEYWAVNAADLLSRRFDAKDSVWARIKNYLSEMVEKIKGLLGLRSDAPLLKALKYLLNRDNFGPERGGTFESRAMLSDIRALGTTDGMLPDISRSSAPFVDIQLDQNGNPTFRGATLKLDYPQPAERFEFIPGPGQQLLNYAIMPTEGFDSLGFVELVVENGQVTALMDIEVNGTGRRAGVGKQVIETILAANPDADVNISNIVHQARGFWAKMGVPEQNLEDGAAYDGTLNWQTYAQAADDGRAAQVGRGMQGQVRRDDARAAQGDRGAGQGGQAPVLSQRDQTQTQEFKRWFGKSAVVDADGKPLVVYHGTTDVFSTFETSTAAGGEIGIWTTSDPWYATWLLTKKRSRPDGAPSAPNVMPVYVSMNDPAVLDIEGEGRRIWHEMLDSGLEVEEPTTLREHQTIIAKSAGGSWDAAVSYYAEEADNNGRDGLIIRNFDDGYGAPTTAYIAFRPEQIKSAIGNSGAFDPTNASIVLSQVGQTPPAQSGWAMPEGSRFDNFTYRFQNKNVDLLRATNAIKAESGAVADHIDAYLQEELFHGRAAKRTQDFVRDELEPLLKDMKKDGITTDQIDKYLHARHAKEANELIAQRNKLPNDGQMGLNGQVITSPLQDGGSGMLTQDAADYLAALDPAAKAKLEAAAAKIDAIIAKTREYNVAYGLESRDTVDGWAAMFKHYVPLMREDHEGGRGTGQGFSIKGPEAKHRTGSQAKVIDILANIAMARERTIVRGEKNRVAVSLAALVKENPNPDVWEFGPVTERRYNKATDSVEVQIKGNWKSANNVLVAKVRSSKGAVLEVGIVFNERNERAVRMAEALKNLDAAQLEGMVAMSAKLTRWFAAINTQYNPIFGIVNLVRDVQGAALNLSSTEIHGKQLEVTKQIPSALRAIYRDERGKTAKNQAMRDLWEELQREGGMTGFRDLFQDSEHRAKAIRYAMDPTSWTESKLGRFVTAGGALRVPVAMGQTGVTSVFRWLSDYNQAMEGATRLAAYKVALDMGLSKQRAASIAKNLTVNFNRKGQVGQQAGAFYAFFNAAMQGTARMGEVLVDTKNGQGFSLKPGAIKIVSGGLLLGSMQAVLLAMAGFDDDEPPQFVRERSVIIPTGWLTGSKDYVSIPMPLGWHVIPNFSRILTEFTLSGFRDPGKRAAQMVGIVADAFNPLGNAGMSWQTVTPTAVGPLPTDIIVALIENQDWTGKPIARRTFNEATPGFKNAKDTASSPAKWAAEKVNALTGGTEYKAGHISPTPDQIDYIIGQAFGGVARELSKFNQTGSALLTGEDLPPHKIPLVGRFYGNADAASSQGNRFYAAVKEMDLHEAQIKGLQRAAGAAKTPEERAEFERELKEYKADNPEADLFFAANVAQRQVQNLRKLKREAMQADAPRERIKELDAKIAEAMRGFNDKVRSRREPDKAPALQQ